MLLPTMGSVGIIPAYTPPPPPPTRANPSNTRGSPAVQSRGHAPPAIETSRKQAVAVSQTGFGQGSIVEGMSPCLHLDPHSPGIQTLEVVDSSEDESTDDSWPLPMDDK